MLPAPAPARPSRRSRSRQPAADGSMIRPTGRTNPAGDALTLSARGNQLRPAGSRPRGAGPQPQPILAGGGPGIRGRDLAERAGLPPGDVSQVLVDRLNHRGYKAYRVAVAYAPDRRLARPGAQAAGGRAIPGAFERLQNSELRDFALGVGVLRGTRFLPGGRRGAPARPLRGGNASTCAATSTRPARRS